MILEERMGMVKLGRTVKYLRERKKITQESLSELTGIDKSELANLEEGTLKCISTDKLTCISSHLDVPYNYMLNVYLHVPVEPI